MTRFNDIVIREDYQTVEVGAGLTWTDVYKYLVPKGLNVVGGRLNGVGVAGLTLGGGECYSLPNGTKTVVTEADNDLWFALKVCINDGDGWRCHELSTDPYYRVDSTTM
jgi:hypothetical protein